MNTKRMVHVAAFGALYIITASLSVNTVWFKFSLASLPIILAGLMYGERGGIEVAFIGSLIYQIIAYGASPTLWVWIIPPVVHGAVVGIFNKNKHSAIVAGQVALFVFNSLAIIADANFYGYSAYAAFMSGIIPRVVEMVVMSVVYSIVVPKILKAVHYEQSRI